MKIEVKGRHVAITDEMRETIARRFALVAKQVSPLAVLEVELCHERNPANPNANVAEATLHLKGTVLRARDESFDLTHAIGLCAEELTRQVKRHREKQRGRRETRVPLGGPGELPAF